MKRLAILAILLTGAALVFAQDPSAVIREITGTVELRTSGSADWVPAKPGDSIGKATMVSTGFKSSALLSVGTSTITVRPLTRLSLEELMSQNSTETIAINLSTGRIRADVKAPSGGRTSLSVQSPTATASVRGTKFEMDSDSIQVEEGIVSYAPAATESSVVTRAVTVSAGQESHVDTDTGRAATVMAAAEASSSLPSLPGQSTVAVSEGGPRTESPGSLSVGVDLGGKIIIDVELQPK